jgi:hypothetical protein
MSHETERDRLIATDTAIIDDPRCRDAFVYGTREDIIWLFTDLYTAYWVARRQNRFN